MQKKKVLIIFPKDSEALFNRDSHASFGGASVQLYNIACELSSRHDILPLSGIPSVDKIDFKDSDSFNFVTLYKQGTALPVRAMSLFFTILRANPHSIIQRGLTPFSPLIALFCAFTGKKLIFMFAHDREALGRYQQSEKRALLLKALLRFSKQLVVQNSFQYNQLKTWSHKLTLLNSGYLLPDKKDFSKDGSILWVGRLVKWKQPELFIKLADCYPHEHFVMIAPVVKDEEQYGRQIAEEVGKRSNIEYLPFCSYHEINSFYEKAKVFVNTSSQEGFPNTFIQAAMFATPLLSLNTDPGEFIRTYNCGIFCNNSFDRLKEALKDLLSEQKRYKTLSDNAFAYVKEHHNIQLTIDRLITLL